MDFQRSMSAFCCLCLIAVFLFNGSDARAEDAAHKQLDDRRSKRRAPKSKMTSLDLRNVNVASPIGYWSLAPYSNLQILDLRTTGATDAYLIKELPRLKKLQILKLGRTPVTGPGLKGLVGLKHLHTLDASCWAMTDAGMKYIAQLKNLRVLNLGGTRVTDAGMKYLARLKNLRVLKLGKTRVGDAGLKALMPLKHSLRELHLPYKVTTIGFRELVAFKNLRSLHLAGNQRVPWQEWKELQKSLPDCQITGNGQRDLWRNPLPNNGKKVRMMPGLTKKIKTWIRDLGASSFRKRELASQKLKETGAPAVIPLFEAVDDVADLEVRLRAKEILDHLVKTYSPPDKNVPPKLLVLLAGQGQPATKRWAVTEIVGRYKDGAPGAKDLFKKLYPIFSGKRQRDHLRAMDRIAAEVQEMHARFKRYPSYDLDAKILQQEEELARDVDRLFEARGK